MSKANCGCIRWAVDLKQNRPSFKELCHAVSCIQPEEKERLLRFYFRDDFNSSLVGRLLMRKFVKESTGLNYNHIQFRRDVKGKPFLVNDLGSRHIDFNVSHQGDFCVLAGVFQEVSQNSKIQIGVDIMKIEYSGGKPLHEFFRLMNRNFSESEWKFIKSRQDEREQLKAFMRYWCLKESYVKNVGVGITVDLQKISFNIKTDVLVDHCVTRNTSLRVNGNPMDEWIFEEHLIDENHCAAISFKDAPSDLSVEPFKFLSFIDLLENTVPLFATDENYCKAVEKKEYKMNT